MKYLNSVAIALPGSQQKVIINGSYTQLFNLPFLKFLDMQVPFDTLNAELRTKLVTDPQGSNYPQMQALNIQDISGDSGLDVGEILAFFKNFLPLFPNVSRFVFRGDTDFFQTNGVELGTVFATNGSSLGQITILSALISTIQDNDLLSSQRLRMNSFRQGLGNLWTYQISSDAVRSRFVKEGVEICSVNVEQFQNDPFYQFI